MTDSQEPKKPRQAPRQKTPKQLEVLGELARGMGIATRSMVNGVNRLFGCGGSKKAPAARPAPRSAGRQQELERLARELLALTEGVAAEEVSHLLTQREFWQLLTKLQTLRARLPPKQRPDAARQGKNAPSPAAEPTPETAQAAEAEAADQPERAAPVAASEAPPEPEAASAEEQPDPLAGVLEKSPAEEGAEEDQEESPAEEDSAEEDSEEGALDAAPDIEGANAVSEPVKGSKRKKKE